MSKYASVEHEATDYRRDNRHSILQHTQNANKRANRHSIVTTTVYADTSAYIMLAVLSADLRACYHPTAAALVHATGINHQE
eukprot:7935-Heterococcus_DN1.PRE.2